jgi:hypothetical protein
MKGLAFTASVALLLLAGSASAQSDAPKPGAAAEAVPDAAAPAVPSTAVVLTSGQTLTFEVHADRTLKVLKIEPITQERVSHFRPGRDLISSAADGQVVVTLLYDPRIGTLMKIENSAEFSFDYSAIVSGIDKDGGAYRAPVDLCPAVKGAAFYEIWDHPISMIYLSGFGRHDKPPRCPGPSKPAQPKGEAV